MDDDLRGVIHDMTLQARELLTTEAWELLEGTYGLDASGKLAPAERLPALRDDPEAQETRRRLEKFLEDEAKAGLRGREAILKLIKEAAFTHLNRFVAFKMLEARRLIRQTLARGPESNAFKFYLVEHPEEEEQWKVGDVDTAYRHFLLWQCAQMAKEIKVLFDPDNLASRLFPRPRALKDLLDLLNAPTMFEAWALGNEETIGWVYQYFNEPDLDIFRSQSAPKVPPHLMAAKTQQFTPRWIVKFLVQNTLGRLWVQMHPDTALAEKMDYLVSYFGEISRTASKPVREITLLDPACGTMHFGLVAFDLLVEMYKEELARAGEPGWPGKPSVEREEDISAAILANNLFGIDIDLRAVQLSALTLYLRAKTLNPQTTIVASNLACADVVLLNGARLGEFLQEMAFTRPVYERVIKALWAQLRDAGQLGSLLRIEKNINDLVAEERNAHRADLLLFPNKEHFADTYVGGEEFWELLDIQIMQAFDEFARRQAQRGLDVNFFAGEAVKGFKVLDVMMRRYDVVVTNPPYVDNRDYNPGLKSFIEAAYPASKRNLYSAFLERCLEFVSDAGRVGIVTPQTFMFISSFEKIRAVLRHNMAIETLVHTGLNTFPDAVVDAAFYVLRCELDAQSRAKAIGTYFRLVKEPDPEAKRLRFEQALTHLLNTENDPVVHHYRQADFDAIPGSPWVYWITPGVRNLFEMLPKLSEVAESRVGLQTSDNFRFLRLWWEVSTQRIGFGCCSQEECQTRAEKWFPYMKGGSFRRWYGNQEYCINYGQNGYELKAWADPLYGNSGWSRIIKSPDFYFRRGVTYSYLTSGTFSARLSPGGFIFDVAGSSLFPEDVSLVLAVMNSTFAAYALKLINPTVNFQVGDLARLPVPRASNTTLQGLVQQAIALAKAYSYEDETTYDFTAPPAWTTGLEEIATRAARLGEIEHQIDEEVYRLYDINDENRAAIEAELADSTQVSLNDEDEEVTNEFEEDTEPEAGMSSEELAIRWISYAVGIVLGRFTPGTEGALGCAIVTADGTSRRLFSPAVATQLRSLADADGVAVLDKGHPDDLPSKVEHALTLMLGEEQAAQVLAAIGGEPGQHEETLRRFLERDFFTRHHLKWYRKRPVYWLLQCPKKYYSLYLYHERVTRDTLPLIRGSRYLEGKINQTRNRIREIHDSLKTAEGKNKRKLEKDLDTLQTQLADLEAFDQAIQRVLNAQSQRGATVGWAPELDDGVILNLAPLHELLPAWKAEPKKYWDALVHGEYDWSHTAMRYWPDRVLAKCRKNKSYAIAHDRLDVYEGDRK